MDSGFLANFKIADIVFNIFWPIILVIYTWFAGRQKATKTQIEKLMTALDVEKEARQKEENRLRDRIKDLENQIAHLATKDDFKSLEISMVKVEEQLKATDDTLDRVEKSTNEIKQYLLEKKL